MKRGLIMSGCVGTSSDRSLAITGQAVRLGEYQHGKMCPEARPLSHRVPLTRLPLPLPARSKRNFPVRTRRNLHISDCFSYIFLIFSRQEGSLFAIFPCIFPVSVTRRPRRSVTTPRDHPNFPMTCAEFRPHCFHRSKNPLGSAFNAEPVS